MQTRRMILLSCWAATLLTLGRAFSPPRMVRQRQPHYVLYSELAPSTTVATSKTASFANETTTHMTPSSSTLQTISHPTTRPSTTSLPIYYLALAGGLATGFGDFCLHPIDCIKTFQQSELGYGTNLLQAATLLVVHTGPAGLLHGFWTYGLSDAAAGAAKFSVWESYKRNNNNNRSDNAQQNNPLYMGAALAFLASSLFLVPGEFLKQQLQMGYFDSLGDAVGSIYHSQGLRGFYTGYDGVLLRDIPHTVLELCLYEQFKRLFRMEFLSAAVTGAITAVLTTPLDSVKTKLMVDYPHYSSYEAVVGEDALVAQPLDPNVFDVISQTWMDHGVEGFFCGVVARVCWIVPFTVIYLPTYDWLKGKLVEHHNR